MCGFAVDHGRRRDHNQITFRSIESDRAQLRMCGKVGHIVDRAISDLRFSQSSDHLVAGQRGENPVDFRI